MYVRIINYKIIHKPFKIMSIIMVIFVISFTIYINLFCSCVGDVQFVDQCARPIVVYAEMHSCDIVGCR